MGEAVAAADDSEEAQCGEGGLEDVDRDGAEDTGREGSAALRAEELTDHGEATRGRLVAGTAGGSAGGWCKSRQHGKSSGTVDCGRPAGTRSGGGRCRGNVGTHRPGREGLEQAQSTRSDDPGGEGRDEGAGVAGRRRPASHCRSQARPRRRPDGPQRRGHGAQRAVTEG